MADLSPKIKLRMQEVFQNSREVHWLYFSAPSSIDKKWSRNMNWGNSSRNALLNFLISIFTTSERKIVGKQRLLSIFRRNSLSRWHPPRQEDDKRSFEALWVNIQKDRRLLHEYRQLRNHFSEVPLLRSKSSIFAVWKCHFCKLKVALLESPS